VERQSSSTADIGAIVRQGLYTSLELFLLQWFIFSLETTSPCMTGWRHVETFPSATSNNFYQGAKRSQPRSAHVRGQGASEAD